MNKRTFPRITTAILFTFAILGSASLSADGGMEIDLVTHNSVVINATPAAIWPKIVDPSEWKSGAKMVLLEGEADQPRAKFKAVMPDTPDQVAFYAYNVEVIPERWRTVRLHLPDGTMMGFAGWELAPQANGTRVSYHVYSLVEFPESSLEGMTDEERTALRADYLTSNAKRFQDELEVLKNQVENP